jgi:hypothetical protein
MIGMLDRAPTPSVAMVLLAREPHLFHHTNGVWHHYVPFSARLAVAFKWVGIVASPPVPIDKLERATIKYNQG